MFVFYRDMNVTTSVAVGKGEKRKRDDEDKESRQRRPKKMSTVDIRAGRSQNMALCTQCPFQTGPCPYPCPTNCLCPFECPMDTLELAADDRFQMEVDDNYLQAVSNKAFVWHFESRTTLGLGADTEAYFKSREARVINANEPENKAGEEVKKEIEKVVVKVEVESEDEEEDSEEEDGVQWNLEYKF